MGAPGVEVGGDRRLGLAILCTSCGRLTLAPPLGPLPAPVLRWSALPLPEGWRWAVASIGAEGGNRIAPVCGRCAAGQHDEAPAWRTGGDASALPPVLSCPHCLAVAPIVRPVPAMAASWRDVPLPEGWAWTLTTIRGVAGVPDSLVPTCAICARLMAQDVDAFYLRRCKARDLHSIDGHALGGIRGLPVSEG